MKTLIYQILKLYYGTKYNSWCIHAEKIQLSELNRILKSNKQTHFGIQHGFQEIKTYNDYKNKVKIQTFDTYNYWLKQFLVVPQALLTQKVKYLAGSSKTTKESFEKIYPITNQIIKNNIFFSLMVMILYSKRQKLNLLKFKMLYLTSTPKLEKKGNFLIGLLSGITFDNYPFWYKKNSLPSFKTSSINNYREKISAIADEVKNSNISILAGTPPWVIHLLRLLPNSNKIKILTFGGLSIIPYLKEVRSLCNDQVQILETYACTEGNLACQIDTDNDKGLLLNIDGGIFYEFITLDDFNNNQWNNRLFLSETKLNIPYVLIITNCSGLYAFVIGDIIELTKKNPYYIKIIGRTKQYITINKIPYYDYHLAKPCLRLMQEFDFPITEFCFIPGNSPNSLILIGEYTYPKERHELIEFISQLEAQLKLLVPELRDLTLITVQPESFVLHMEKNFKVGGQYKIARLQNDSEILDFFETNQRVLNHY